MSVKLNCKTERLQNHNSHRLWHEDAPNVCTILLYQRNPFNSRTIDSDFGKVVNVKPFNSYSDILLRRYAKFVSSPNLGRASNGE